MLENESMTLPTDVLRQCMHGNKVFVETGSYDGRTIQQALDCGYGYVVSIELSDSYFNVCAARFAGNKRVKLVRGDSYHVLYAAIQDIQEPITFWLDAHVQEGVFGTVHIPLLHELQQIARHPIKTHTIMIDDVRLMGSVYWGGGVTVEEVTAALYTINPHYNIFNVDSKVAEGDILVAHYHELT